MQYLSRVAVLVLVVLLLAGCGGDGDNDDAVPTLIQLPELTESAGPGPVGPPPVTPQATDAVPEITAEATPPILPPNLTPETTELPEFAGSASTAIPSGSSELLNAAEGLTDFSSLEVGQSVRLRGQLETVAEGTDSSDVLTLRDEAGESIEVMVPPGVVSQLIDTLVDVSGMIVSADETITGRLGIIPTAVDSTTESAGAGLPTGLGGPEATAETTADGSPASAETTPGAPQTSGGPPITTGGPPLLIGGEQLDFTLDADLTALGAYDGLIAEVGDALADYFWSRLSGSSEAGWLIEFYNPDADETLAYNVQPDGSVYVVLAPPSVALPGAVIQPIERDRVVVDSDVAAAQASDVTQGPTVGVPSLMLAAAGEDDIEWTILGLAPMTLDATVAP